MTPGGLKEHEGRKSFYPDLCSALDKGVEQMLAMKERREGERLLFSIEWRCW